MENLGNSCEIWLLTLSDRADVYIRQNTIRDDVYIRWFSTISTRLIVQARIVSVT